MLHFTLPVTIARPSGVDEYGNPSASFASPTLVPAHAIRGGADLVYLRPDAVISDRDRLIVDGRTYSIVCQTLYTHDGVRAIEVRLTALEVQS